MAEQGETTRLLPDHFSHILLIDKHTISSIYTTDTIPIRQHLTFPFPGRVRLATDLIGRLNDRLRLRVRWLLRQKC